MKFLLSLAVAVLCAATVSCSSDTTASANVVARVNGVDITAAELDRKFAGWALGVEPLPAQEEIEDLKLQILNEMIINEILLQLADASELTATDAEVDVRFNEFKSQYTAERFEEVLAEQMMTVEELREEMRASLTIDKLINKEITSKISVSEAQIEEFYNTNKASFNLPETFHIAHILVTPVADSEVANLEGDDAATEEDAREKAARLLGQVQGGQDFATLARQYSEDASTAANGGVLGFQSIDAIAGVDPAMAEATLQMRVGETFPRVVETRYGFHIMKLLERARNNAEIRNFFADRILDGAT